MPSSPEFQVRLTRKEAYGSLLMALLWWASFGYALLCFGALLIRADPWWQRFFYLLGYLGFTAFSLACRYAMQLPKEV